jgi:spore maturation protein SpmA
MLNLIWVLLILGGFLASLFQFFVGGKADIFNEIMTQLFSTSKTGFEISIGLTGVMCFWLGMMKIAEDSGIVLKLTKFAAPVFRRLFPSIPSDHPAIASMVMNLSANMLGLDNAATPFGLKAMKEMQELNTAKDTASDAQIMFLVINTASVTIIPVSVFTYLFELGYPNPTDVFMPILIATSFSTLSGVIATCLFQKINLFKSGVASLLAIAFGLLALLIFAINQLPKEEISKISLLVSNLFILGTIGGFIAYGCFKKVKVYESFIQGAKEGFQTAIGIIPYLIAILVAISVFRTSGALDVLLSLFKSCFALFLSEENLEFIHAIPTALLKPLSGSGARGMMIETIKTHGVDSFVAKLVSVIQGSSETTFYVLAVYFGSVGITKSRHAVTCGLIADFVSIVVAIFVCYLFFK